MDKVVQIKKAGDWGCSLRYSGTVHMLWIASMAADKEIAGEEWTPMEVCQEYAQSKGKTQWSIWYAINYALLHSRVCKTPREAILELVEVGVDG